MVDAGDLLLTRGAGWAARLIRLGAALLDEPNLDNHVAIVRHRDDTGVWWAIEGRPGALGGPSTRWPAVQNYVSNPAHPRGPCRNLYTSPGGTTISMGPYIGWITSPLVVVVKLLPL